MLMIPPILSFLHSYTSCTLLCNEDTNTARSAIEVCFTLLAADKAKSSDVTLHFYFPAQRILNGARLSPALYVALWHWHRFLASDQA